MAGEFRAPKGTFDLLPPHSEAVLAVRDGLSAPLRTAGYGYVETPAFEDTRLFARGVGESTDIVSKEMYTFADKGGRSITLRPEGTASVLRAALEAGLDRGALPVKLWYGGSFYRYERPQAGRYRHFSQVGAEVLGSGDPAVDAELIVLAVDAYRGLGLRSVRLLVNSLGCMACRPAFRAALQSFLAGLDLDEDTRRRAAVNPLRVLDDKRPEVQAQLGGAPVVGDHLCDECRAHHAEVLSLLDEAEVAYEPTPRLVRGLDYYTRTTFEFLHDGLGAQSAIGGGGRYDGLSEQIGGGQLPSVGWALGVDRTLLALEAEGVPTATTARVDVLAGACDVGARQTLLGLVRELRRAGVRADYDWGHEGRSPGKLIGAAAKQGARFAVFAGAAELEAGLIAVKDLVNQEQQQHRADAVVSVIEGQLK